MSDKENSDAPSPTQDASTWVDTCLACAKPFKSGDLYFLDVSGDCIHADCCGPEREGYTNKNGDPLGPDEPIPAPSIWAEQRSVELPPQEPPRPAAELMADADCRIETMIWLPGMGGQDCLTEAFDEFLNYLPERVDAPLYRQLPLLAEFRDLEEGPDTERVADRLIFSGVSGFLVQAATPVRHYPKPDATYYYSGWGHYHTEWLYAATESEIASVCVAWAESKTVADRGANSSPPQTTEVQP